jgi:hypothetical protein
MNFYRCLVYGNCRTSAQLSSHNVMKRHLFIVCNVVLLLLPVSLLAQQSGSSNPAPAFWQTLFSNALSFTLLLIFLSALLGTLLKNFAIDKCLRHFTGFHVTVEFTDSDLIWGTLHVYSTGVEIAYDTPRLDSDGHVESSYIVYASEYPQIQSICRYHGDLSAKERELRETDIRTSYQPTIFARTVRWLRNLVNTFSDAFTKALNLIIGQMKKLSPGSVIFEQDAQLTKIGSEIIGYAGNAYDPILERHIGKKVVVQVNYADRKTEYLGILKEYTAAFLELLNVHYQYRIVIPLKGRDTGKIEISGVMVRQEGQAYVLHNQSATPVQLNELHKDDQILPLHIEVAAGQHALVWEDDATSHDVAVLLTTTRIVDSIVPRAKALIRHAGPQERVGWKELLGFDEVEYFFGRFTRSAAESLPEPPTRPRE